MKHIGVKYNYSYFRFTGVDDSYVHGYVYNNVFQGRIRLNGVPTYIVETSKPYADQIDTKRYHSFIYKNEDLHDTKNIRFGSEEAERRISKLSLHIHTTLIRRPYNVHNVRTTSFQRKVVCILGLIRIF